MPPGGTARLVGDAMIVKSPVAGAWTTRVTCVLWLSVPSDAVIVSGYEPAGVVELVATVSVDDAVGAGVLDVGLKLSLAPLGSPLMLQLTVPL